MWLFATFETRLLKPVLVQAETAEPLIMALNVEGFDVEVLLTLNSDLGRIKKGSDNSWHYAASALALTISCQDSLLQCEYFSNGCLPEFKRIAELAVKRLARFLEHRLWHPLFYAIDKSLDDFAKA